MGAARWPQATVLRPLAMGCEAWEEPLWEFPMRICLPRFLETQTWRRLLVIPAAVLLRRLRWLLPEQQSHQLPLLHSLQLLLRLPPAHLARVPDNAA